MWWCLCFKIYEGLVVMSLSHLDSSGVFTSLLFIMTDASIRALEVPTQRLSLRVRNAVEIQF